jgi:hypothetical protein
VVLERDDSPRRVLARIAATAVGRHDNGGEDIARLAFAAAGKPQVDLITNTRDGAARCTRLCETREGTLAEYIAAPAISHRGNFGTYPSAGAQQFAANVLMLSNAEAYAPLANGKSRPAFTPPHCILHDAASYSGNHAAYVLAR